jgi:hypothetical protein
MPLTLRSILSTTKTARAIDRTAAFGTDRDALERRYREARAAYIHASNDLSRFGIRYDELLSDVPDSIDLAGYEGIEREPTKPRIVKANELDPER